jgi:hypothetical protein
VRNDFEKLKTDYELVKNYEFKIQVLEKEIEALRSVLSEWECDKSQFTQWHAAQAFAEIRNHIK